MGSSFSTEFDPEAPVSCQEGVANNGSCYCYTGWFGDHCEMNLSQYLPRSFLAWRVIFSMIYISFSLYSGWVIFKSRIRSVMLKGTRTTYENKWNLTGEWYMPHTFHVLTSKKLIIVLIFLMSLTRSVWLVVDPFDFNQFFRNFQVNKLLNEISYSIEFSIYMVVLFIWYTLAEYTYLRSEEHNHGMPKFILVLKHFGLPKAVIFYSMQILLSTIKIYKKEEFLGYIKSTQYILAGFLGFLFLEFVIMSYFLSKTLSKERHVLLTQEHRTKQASEKKNYDQRSNKRKQTFMPGQFVPRALAHSMVKQNSQQNMSPSWNLSKRESINASGAFEEPTKKRRAGVFVKEGESNPQPAVGSRNSLKMEANTNMFLPDADSERMLFIAGDGELSNRELDLIHSIVIKILSISVLIWKEEK